MKAQVHDFQNIIRSIVFEREHFECLIEINRLSRSLVSIPPNELTKDLQTLKGVLCAMNGWDDLSILKMIQTATTNKSRCDQSVKLLFEIFKNDIPSFVEPFEAQHYERMYSTIKELFPRIIFHGDDTLHDFLQMYGRVIVGCERYLEPFNENALYCADRGLFNQAIEEFMGYQDHYPILEDVKKIKDLEEKIICSQCKDEEKTAAMDSIRRRTMENIRVLKERNHRGSRNLMDPGKGLI